MANGQSPAPYTLNPTPYTLRFVPASKSQACLNSYRERSQSSTTQLLNTNH